MEYLGVDYWILFYCLACIVFEFLIIRSWLTRQNSPVDRIKMHFTRTEYTLADCAASRNDAAGPKHEAIPISTWPGRRLSRVIISDRPLDAWSACTDTSR